MSKHNQASKNYQKISPNCSSLFQSNNFIISQLAHQSITFLSIHIASFYWSANQPLPRLRDFPTRWTELYPMMWMLSQERDLDPRRVRILRTNLTALCDKVPFLLLLLLMQEVSRTFLPTSPIRSRSLMQFVSHSMNKSKLSSSSAEISMKFTSNRSASDWPSSMETSRTRTRSVLLPSRHMFSVGLIFLHVKRAMVRYWADISKLRLSVTEYMTINISMLRI